MHGAGRWCSCVFTDLREGKSSKDKLGAKGTVVRGSPQCCCFQMELAWGQGLGQWEQAEQGKGKREGQREGRQGRLGMVKEINSAD